MEEGGTGRDSKDAVRTIWRKLVELEERLKVWKKILGGDLKEKFRSEQMKGGRSDRNVIDMVMRLKLKDERKHQRELRSRREIVRGDLETVCDSKRTF